VHRRRRYQRNSAALLRESLCARPTHSARAARHNGDVSPYLQIHKYPELFRKSETWANRPNVRADVAQESCAAEFTRVAIDRFGRIDILISNAAVSVVRAIHEHTPAEWDNVMDVNVKAHYWAARHVIPVMIGQHGGLFLLTGSISGEVGIPAQGAYAASKGALHQMTRQMAIEYAKYNIRLNTIACGTVDTPLVQSSAKDSGDEKDFWDMLRRRHPIGRIATAEEIAAFCAFLASDYATFFTGSVLMIDGGYTAE